MARLLPPRGSRRLLRWIPVLFISLIVCWSYYAYVYELCILTIQLEIEKVTDLVFFHLFFVMLAWSYWKTVFARPANPPKQFQLPLYDKELYQKEERQEYKQHIVTRAAKFMPINIIAEIRYCEKCQMIKPDQCHHCSTCDICVLQMDHHCPWVNNCIGFTNRKSFLLLLLYSLLYFLFISATVLYHFIRCWPNGTPTLRAKVNIISLFLVSIVFFMNILSFLHYHCWLVAKNMSTIGNGINETS